MGTSGDHDLIDAVILDHREIEGLLEELEFEPANGDPQRRRRLVDHLITEMVWHAVAAERFLHPQVRGLLHGGSDLVDDALDDYAPIEAAMKRLEAFDVTNPEFAVLLEQLIKDIRGHMENEEGGMLPRLRAAADREHLRDLATMFKASKETAPTRPHPALPDSQPANTLLDPGAGLVDRLRDALTRRNR